MAIPLDYNLKDVPWYYEAEARSKGKTKVAEADTAQGMTRSGRVYMPQNYSQVGSSKETAPKQPVVETGNDDLWRKIQAKEYSVIENLNKTLAQISILPLLQNSEAHNNALMKVLSEAYVPIGIKVERK